MAKEKIEGLITELHDRLGEEDTSTQQQMLMLRLRSELDDWEGPKPNGNIKEIAMELFAELEKRHPKAAKVTEEIIESLRHMGF